MHQSHPKPCSTNKSSKQNMREERLPPHLDPFHSVSKLTSSYSRFCVSKSYTHPCQRPDIKKMKNRNGSKLYEHKKLVSINRMNCSMLSPLQFGPESLDVIILPYLRYHLYPLMPFTLRSLLLLRRSLLLQWWLLIRILLCIGPLLRRWPSTHSHVSLLPGIWWQLLLWRVARLPIW